jgi:hypothetical protein
MAKDATATTPTANPVVAHVTSSALHLIVTCHGLWQPAHHMNFWTTTFEAQLPHVIVLNSVANQMQRSTCGIKTAGQRMATEILDFLKHSPAHIQKISFFSFSAGGLWAHHAATLLHQQGTFNTVSPQFFITVASPLLGVVYQPSHTSHFWFFRHISNCFTGNCAGCLGGRTVEDLVLGDDVANPLLLQMSQPNNEYGQCLQAFQCERLSYCNTVNDFSVPFESAGLSWCNPFATGEVAYHSAVGGRFFHDYDTYYQTKMLCHPITQETLGQNASCDTWCHTIKEIVWALLAIVVLLVLWLPIMSTVTMGFLVPVVLSLATRCLCWDKSSNRKHVSRWCLGRVCCCGPDSLFPFHCLRRWCCRRNRSSSQLWFEMHANRRLQNIKVIPVSITSKGNAHGKIVNRPCCCCVQSWPEGREVATHVVARMKGFL